MFNYEPYKPKMIVIHIQKNDDEFNLCGHPLGERITTFHEEEVLCSECSDIRRKNEEAFSLKMLGAS
jgi:hypothetical protein